MRVRRVVSVADAAEEPRLQQWIDDAWREPDPACTPDGMARWLAPLPAAALAHGKPTARADGVTLPCQPLSFRDCMLFREHWVQSSRGYARRFLPWSTPITRVYEGVTRHDFPAFRPPPLWNDQPVYYFGNHLSFVVSGTPVAIPPFTSAFDFELELGWVLSRPLRDASVEEAEAAIGGFVVVNDFSCRDLQRAEMQTGLGPQKSKHSVSSMSDTLVTADALRGRIGALTGSVELNGRRLSTPTTRGMKYRPAEVLAFLSRSEPLYPGELIATGTLPGGCGLELGPLLRPGDTLRLVIDDVGEIRHELTAAPARAQRLR